MGPPHWSLASGLGPAGALPAVAGEIDRAGERAPFELTRVHAAMAAAMPWSSAPNAPPSNDPNEMLVRMDRNISQIFHWVRLGFVVVIVLLILVAVGF